MPIRGGDAASLGFRFILVAFERIFSGGKLSSVSKSLPAFCYFSFRRFLLIKDGMKPIRMRTRCGWTSTDVDRYDVSSRATSDTILGEFYIHKVLYDSRSMPSGISELQLTNNTRRLFHKPSCLISNISSISHPTYIISNPTHHVIRHSSTASHNFSPPFDSRYLYLAQTPPRSQSSLQLPLPTPLPSILHKLLSKLHRKLHTLGIARRNNLRRHTTSR
jgi:hypothetical protein